MVLRLLAVLAASLLRPRAGFLDECAITLRVWPNDLDSNLHMTNSRYLLAMDVGRWDLVVRTGFWRVLWRRRWFMLTIQRRRHRRNRPRILQAG